jgi:hypothetical protein
MRADLRGKPAGHFRHRREQRQPTGRRRHRLVGNAGCAGGEQIARLLQIGCQMQIGEQDLALAQLGAFRHLRLFHLHDHVGRLEDRILISGELRAGRFIFRIRQTRPKTGAGLDDDVVSMMHQFGDGRRRQADAKFIVLDFLRHTDAHDCLPRPRP